MNIQNDLYVLMPELILAVGALLLLLIGAFRGDKSANTLTILSVFLIGASAYASMVIGDGTAFHGAFVMDSFARFTKAVILWSSAACVLMAHRFFSLEKSERFELPVLIVLASLGMSLMVSANNFIALYMGLELQSLALYVLAAFNRDSVRSSEAGLKYFVLGSLSSGMMLYGISMIYGYAGTMDFTGVAHVIKSSGSNIGLTFGIVFLLAGLAFKISAVPFHMWTPDVYEGAPTPITAYMAAAVKAAAFAALLRVWREAFPGALVSWHLALWWLAVLTMVVGNLVALAQKNIKRMLAYSSIAHAGYLLVAVVANSQLGTAAFLFYVLAYTLATMGAFGVVIAVGEPGERHQQLSDFAGLWTVRPWLAGAMAVFMLALLGFPIAGGMGFFAKWYVLQAALNATHPETSLAVVLVLTSVLSAGYYLAVVMAMFMRPRSADAPALRPVRTPTFLVVYASAIILLFFGIFPGGFAALAGNSMPTITASAPAGSPPTSMAGR